MDSILVSAIIINWNHGRFLKGCLDALLTQGYPSTPLRTSPATPLRTSPATPLRTSPANTLRTSPSTALRASPATTLRASPAFDVTVVDNGSIDGSPEWVASHYPSVRLLTFPDNRGFSHAFNHGAHCTDGTFVLSLNPDVTVRPGFISELVRTMGQDERIGMVAPKLLQADAPTVLDSTCLFVDRRRRPYDRGQGKVDQGQYDAQFYGFGACGAAALYRRTMLEDLALDDEYLDEDFFAYYEDADLAWRAQSRGWRCVYAPGAVATHARGWGDTLHKRGHARKDGRGPRLALRNRYLMTIKNDAWRYFLADLPLILAAEIPRLAYASLVAPEVLLGLVDLVRAWSSAVRKRRWIRGRRTVDDAMVRRWFVTPESAMAQS